MLVSQEQSVFVRDGSLFYLGQSWMVRRGTMLTRAIRHVSY